ncbi:MAG TPA: hypothetical protein VGM83_18765 [Devosiaceae bacterium]|jgi:hypothetical protein
MRLAPMLISLILVATPLAAEAAQPHHCAADAVAQAEKLLKFHSDNDDRATVDPKSVKVVAPIRALMGKGHFDVLEVEGSIYKGEYRMHLIYAQMPGDCVLMGEEILERSDPY